MFNITGTTTAAGTQFSFPTSQVQNQTTTTPSNTLTVPANSIIYPGMDVTLASGNAGGGALTATTVQSVSGNTVTLNGSFTTVPTTAASVIFGKIDPSTATNAAATTVAGSNIVALGSSTSGLYIGRPHRQRQHPGR